MEPSPGAAAALRPEGVPAVQPPPELLACLGFHVWHGCQCLYALSSFLFLGKLSATGRVVASHIFILPLCLSQLALLG